MMFLKPKEIHPLSFWRAVTMATLALVLSCRLLALDYFHATHCSLALLLICCSPWHLCFLLGLLALCIVSMPFTCPVWNAHPIGGLVRCLPKVMLDSLTCTPHPMPLLTMMSYSPFDYSLSITTRLFLVCMTVTSLALHVSITLLIFPRSGLPTYEELLPLNRYSPHTNKSARIWGERYGQQQASIG